MEKKFIGPHLRRLRVEHSQTQAEMGRALGISTSYVNLLEKNERSVSVPVLLKLFETYGVDWRDIAEDDDTARLADLRAVFQDPLFESARPDLAQLRAALVHSPDVARAILTLHGAYEAASDQLLSVAGAGTASAPAVIAASPESAVHGFFRRNANHFPELEDAAESFWGGVRIPADEAYGALKALLMEDHGVSVRVVPVADLPSTLREYREDRREVLLSEALDHPNRMFQLVHVTGLIRHRDIFERLLERGELGDARSRSRCLVELANYFAAAVLMPYGPFLAEATASKYDMDHMATRFGVSFEQACHRTTTLQRTGARGVPFFFLRIDRAGNVTKRFNATDFHLAEHGGACPRLEVHTVFGAPGKVIPQVVEMPDRSQFFVFARTVDRPTFTRHAQDARLAVAMGCALEHVEAIGYAEDMSIRAARVTPIGINCRVCPRARCDHRAHHAVVLPAPVDANRRGATRYES